MPLGFFGGGSSSKPQQIPSSENGKERKEKKEAPEKEIRGTILKLQKATVTIERKLAEGGFAIVYLVSDKQNRQYALKRQFVGGDDLRQVEACKRESQIISTLRGHKNIVCYMDHLLARNTSGVYDYMLLTAYYKHSVLHLMNDRLAGGKALSVGEILSIFCDMTEAVARLHHSQTPVIHRDLKVENILIDDRNRAAPPIYVLCDFGSATTRILSAETQSVSSIQEEIERYTTLSYRSPEMIDIYEGKPIGTKADIWAMGVMLYKLCYFSLPFGESALAIQNGAFSFPSQPSISDSIRALIFCLLDSEIDRRPNIYQCASLAFEAANRDCPINNVHSVPRVPLSSAISSLQAGKNLGAPLPIPKNPSVASNLDVPTSTLCSVTPPKIESTTTSVNPRLRPKPTTSVSAVPTIPPSPKLGPAQPSNGKADPIESMPPPPPQSVKPPIETPTTKSVDLGFTDLVADEAAIPRDRAQTDAHRETGFVALGKEAEAPSTMSLPSASNVQVHRRNVSDTSHIIKSAFKPYSQTHQVSVTSSSTQDNSLPVAEESWNPFLAAPYKREEPRVETDARYRDSPNHSDSTSIDSSDPFGAAPFDLPPRVPPHLTAQPREDDTDSVGSAGDLSRKMEQMEEDSEMDEQRMKARRRYSYEHIDGVGEEGSSDSRGRTEGESTDDLSKNEESSHDDENDSSQQTDVASDDGGGRPLLEDDGLEDDYEDNNSSMENYPPLYVDPRSCNTNPFLNQDLTPKISPAERSGTIWSPPGPSEYFYNQTRKEMSLEDRFGSTYAPATLPRQVTPLAPKPVAPPKPLTGPVVFTAPAPQALAPEPIEEPIIGELIQVAATPPETATSIDQMTDATSNSPVITITKTPGPKFVEGPKTPKPKKSKEKKRVELRSSGSEFETDGSEAEMCISGSSDKISTSKKKKKSPAFHLLGSNPSVAPEKLSSSKKTEKRKNSTGKRGSVGALNSSFVNSSFQAEDMDSPPHPRMIQGAALHG